MDPSVIIQLVGSLGFPIVCCGALFWFVVKKTEALEQTIEDNTRILQRLYDLLGGVKIDEK